MAADWTSLERTGMLAALALCAVGFGLAFAEESYRSAVWAVLGCAGAVLARVCQAEAHRAGK